MPPVLRAVPPVLLTCLLMTGCSSVELGTPTPSGTQNPAPGAPAGSGRAIAVGAGPQKHYTVQQQPAAGSCHYRLEHGEPLEDPACTPGAISPAVTQANLKSTICHKGRLHLRRASLRVCDGLNAASYGYTGSMGDAEYDHLISLQLGGDPNDSRNLWVEPADPGHGRGAGVNNKKDPVEMKLHTAVCKGQIPLAAAQQAIVTDWTTALTTLHLG
ncbi:hypothetical protein ABZT02_41410 [Streptomyces sp. NPDC005402]|uniref:hypothetical protein n=1 Tax=Streptomyces sp. NPDC005402 TaxID=3155338 RepID=UPI0033BD5D3A